METKDPPSFSPDGFGDSEPYAYEQYANGGKDLDFKNQFASQVNADSDSAGDALTYDGWHGTVQRQASVGFLSDADVSSESENTTETILRGTVVDDEALEAQFQEIMMANMTTPESVSGEFSQPNASSNRLWFGICFTGIVLVGTAVLLFVLFFKDDNQPWHDG